MLTEDAGAMVAFFTKLNNVNTIFVEPTILLFETKFAKYHGVIHEHLNLAEMELPSVHYHPQTNNKTSFGQKRMNEAMRVC